MKSFHFIHIYHEDFHDFINQMINELMDNN